MTVPAAATDDKSKEAVAAAAKKVEEQPAKKPVSLLEGTHAYNYDCPSYVILLFLITFLLHRATQPSDGNREGRIGRRREGSVESGEGNA